MVHHFCYLYEYIHVFTSLKCYNCIYTVYTVSEGVKRNNPAYRNLIHGMIIFID